MEKLASRILIKSTLPWKLLQLNWQEVERIYCVTYMGMIVTNKHVLQTYDCFDFGIKPTCKQRGAPFGTGPELQK